MFGLACLHPPAPHAEAGRQGVLAHEFDHVLLLQPELVLDRLERGAVLPGHLDDAVMIFRCVGYSSGLQALGFPLLLLFKDAGQ